jgi:hypothetical protein
MCGQAEQETGRDAGKASYSMPKPMTYRDLQRWLQRLSEEQLEAPVLITPGADDFGSTDYLLVGELVEVAREHERISGGYEGPALLVKAQSDERQEGERRPWE